MEPKEIIERLNKEIEFIQKEKNFWIKRTFDLNIETIYQGRNLVRDIVIISTTIVGFVIPLFLNSNINFNRNLLLFSATCFIGVILYGISLLVFVLRKELRNLPKMIDESISKLNKDRLAIESAIQNPTMQNYNKAFNEIAERHKDIKKEEKWWDKFINHDIGFLGLFIDALILLIISIFKVNF